MGYRNDSPTAGARGRRIVGAPHCRGSACGARRNGMRNSRATMIV